MDSRLEDFRNEVLRNEGVNNTNAASSVILENDDYGLKARINGAIQRERLFALRCKSMVRWR
jgi:hypothetical protein